MRYAKILVKDVVVGDILKGYGAIDSVEDNGEFITLGYAHNGNWGDFNPTATVLIRRT